MFYAAFYPLATSRGPARADSIPAARSIKKPYWIRLFLLP
jgi:hypothetical protein